MTEAAALFAAVAELRSRYFDTLHDAQDAWDVYDESNGDPNADDRDYYDIKHEFAADALAKAEFAAAFQVMGLEG